MPTEKNTSILARGCALYHRVSTRDQNPALARAELRQAAGARGMEITLDVEETGSGKRNNRPGLTQVMDAARRGKISAVLCWKLDRFGRTTIDLLSNIRELNRAGVRFISTTQGIDLGGGSDAIGNLLLITLAGVAEFERELTSERTALAYRMVQARGGTWGRPRADDAPDGSSVRAERAAGRSWAEIAAKLGGSPTTIRRRFAE